MNTGFYDYREYADKNLRGTNLNFEEALKLFELSLPQLGRIADEIRRRRCGDLVTFVVDRNINYTNVCISKCKFCAFYARSDEDAFVLPLDEILRKIEEAVSVGATQILMQGGMNPDLGMEWFEETFRAIKNRFPHIQLHSLSPPEIIFLSEKEGLSVEEVLLRLRRAGLDSLPGGGAEILSDRIRLKISKKGGSEDWLRVMEAAHRIGMRTTATMMFGHVEEDEDIVEHLFKIRDLQKKTGGFTAFIPWTFQPGNTEIQKDEASATRYLQVLAISRIVLHNIRNIQVSWLTQGFEVASLALLFGANDFGGTMLEENVVRATGKPFVPARVEDIVMAIKSMGRPAARRDTYYKILEYY